MKRGIYKHKSLKERFNNKWTPEPYSGCWLWTGGINGYGYGAIGAGYPQRMRGAHRASWELFCGDIPKGIQVLHRCDTPCCVNPLHLFLGTPSDNIKDKMVKGRYRNQWT